METKGNGLVQSLLGKSPQIPPDVFIAPNASIIGDVVIGCESSIWYQVVLRGDVCPIQVGSRTNIQDACVVHGTRGRFSTRIGNEVTIGHGVILHGTQIEDQVLIGMGSILMDGSRIPEKSIVAAGSLVTEGSCFTKPGLILGRPARWIRELTPEELLFLPQSAQNYIEYAGWYKK